MRLFIVFATILFSFNCNWNKKSSSEGNVCANCYWGHSCGAVTPAEVVAMKLKNMNPGPYYGEQYTQFVCDNGAQKLGVLWTPGPCSKTGGLEGKALNKKFRKIIGKQNCKFGN